ncbi:rhamnan synthesis F family protein [Alloscardovia omnicolens]|uniref:rhamnan synthesis F family protein n=1 Tax=Alloscardovia omnicolens TaxID=419015 RepID=UPI003A615FC7
MLLPQSDGVNRLGIFFFYDGQGVVDDYVSTLLAGFQPFFSDLTVVVNGKLNAEGRSKFRQFTDKIIVRENKGLDVWAYKTALDSYGWDQLADFDEIVLFNATIMGPVYPFEEMFSAMGNKDLDFWGITKFHKVPYNPFVPDQLDYLPEHIQSHFHAYRKSLHTSAEFKRYWDNLPEIKDYNQSVAKHESLFTERFENYGFRWDVYVDTSDIESFSYAPILLNAKELVEKKRMPIFKRRSFFHHYADTMTQSVGTAALDLFEFLRDYTDFDTDLIWQNALRTMNMADLQKNLHLDFVLPDQLSAPLPEGKKYALVMHLYYPDLIDQTLSYAYAMPEGSDLILTVGSQELIDLLAEKTKGMPYNVDIRRIENRGRDVSAFLVGGGKDLMGYDYVAFMHDKKVTQLAPRSKGDGFRVKCFENMLASKAYVSQVIHLFESNPRLGMAMPTAPNHAEYFPVFAFGWGLDFAGTKGFLEDTLGMSVPLDETKEVVAPLGTMFWFRPQALHGLLDRDWEYKDFPPEPNGIDGTLLHFIERAYGYVPQANGFFTAYIFSQRFARVEMTNLEYEVREMIKAAGPKWLAPGLLQITQRLYRGQSLGGHLHNAVASWVEQTPGISVIGRLLTSTRKRDKVKNNRGK